MVIKLIQTLKKFGNPFVVGLFVMLIALSGCERKEPLNSGTFDCSTCYQNKPDYGPLQIKVTINAQNPSVPLVVYAGNIEDNDTIYIDTTYSSDYSVDVPVDRYYSVMAEYKDNNKIILAVDGDKLKTDKNTKDCDQECYYYKGGYIDVRLRK